ncbi:hypothetical protein ACJMK2_033100 [Sinanodonta woodiana]|uniref:Uncharacterized protein n=1 Tax=Sinanodonta woodiana TaxID=1069815 RepID=A0ABD3X3Z6_SINWO
MILTHLLSLMFCGIISLDVGLNGHFLYKPLDGADCYWIEKGKHGPGPRYFEIHCKNPQSKHYSCTYRGNPHHCKWELSRNAAINQLTACSWDSLEYIDECPGVIFDKQ